MSIFVPSGGTRQKQLMLLAKPSRAAVAAIADEFEAAARRYSDVRRVARRRRDRDVQELARAFDVILFAGVRRRSVEVGGPVFARLDTGAVDGHQRPAGNPLDAAVERALLFADVDGDELRQPQFVDRARYAGQRQQAAQRGREGDEARPAMKEQRPVAEAVAHQRQAARLDIPAREGKGAEAPRHTVIAEAFVHGHEEAHVGRAGEFRTDKAQPGGEFLAIVEPGEGRKQRTPIGSRQRMSLAGQVRVRRRDTLHEGRTRDPTRDRPPAVRRRDRSGDRRFRFGIDRRAIERDNAGKCAHRKLGRADMARRRKKGSLT